MNSFGRHNLTPSQITNPASPSSSNERPELIAPLPDAFARRADRARQAAAHHPGMGPYLELIARLADTQHRLLSSLSPSFPDIGALPIPWTDSVGDSPTRELIGKLVTELADDTAAGVELAARYRRATPADLQRQAVALIEGDLNAIDNLLALPLAAAMQIQLAHAVSASRSLQNSLSPISAFCPFCGMAPVASVISATGANAGMRYLCCPMCATQWHRVRSHCVVCDSAEHVGYFSLEPFPGVRAEACSSCEVYLKVMNLETAPYLEPLIDDLASVALDVSMADEGYQRLGLNPFLVPGATV